MTKVIIIKKISHQKATIITKTTNNEIILTKIIQIITTIMDRQIHLITGTTKIVKTAIIHHKLTNNKTQEIQ